MPDDVPAAPPPRGAAGDTPQRAGGGAQDRAAADVDRLAAIFSQARLSVARRISVLRTVTDTLVAGRLDEAGRAIATHEAHTLAGTAGTFGMTRISELALELEELLYRWADDEPDNFRAGHLVRQMAEALPADGPDVDRDVPRRGDNPTPAGSAWDGRPAGG